jgi:ADP-ribose pyrophosphatase
MSAKVNRRTTLFEGRVFQLVRENITLENNVTVDFDIIRHPGASAVVALSEDRNVVLIRQYRHALGDYIWEIPAGTFDGDERPLACAKRELAEEAGVSAREWKEMGAITPVPGYSDEKVHLFLATGLVPTEQDLDPDEVLQAREIPFDRAMEMLYEGVIRDGKTMVGLMLAERICRS